MYIYLTQNLINGKIYIGQSTKSINNLNYFGSGSLIIKAIKKYGKKNFNKIILIKDVETIEKLNTLEKYYIKLFSAQEREIGYNILPGGAILVTKEMIEKGVHTKKYTIQENGKSISYNAVQKALYTSNNTILDNGLTIKQNSTNKRLNTISKIEENGKSIAYNTTMSALKTKRSTIIDGKNMCVLATEKAVNTWNNKVKDNPQLMEDKINKMLEKFYKIEENGFTLIQNISSKSAKTMKENGTFQGSNHPNAKIINIYNKNNELVIQCNGNFSKICEQNNYPANKFFKCLKESIPVYFDIPCGVRTKAIKNDWIKYEGWSLEYLN